MTLAIFSTLLITILLPILLTPITLGLFIIILAALTAINIFFTTASWFRLILFLIYIGGLLVIFAYFLAIRPNNKIKILDPIILPLFVFLSFLFSSIHSLLLPTSITSNLIYSNFHCLLTLNFLPTLIIIAFTLLVILISAVKITNRSLGALRPFSPNVLTST